MTLKVTQVKGEALKIGKKCRKSALTGGEITIFRGTSRKTPTSWKSVVSVSQSARRDHEIGQTQMLSRIN